MKLLKEDKEDEAKDHRVPLPRLALEILSRVPRRSEKYVFPVAINKNRALPRPISDGTMTAGLRSVGITQEVTTCHGARTAADSITNESNLFNPDAIERLLAHKLHGGEVRNAYNRADFWEERVKIMEWWGELFESFTKE